MNGLDLFSGIGGLTLALSEWVKPIAYCEIDRYAQALLLSRMRTGQLPIAPIWDDVRTLSSKDVPGPIDIIYGGFPCQDISEARGEIGEGLAGKRSGLFFEIMRLADEIKPKFIFLENVRNIRSRGLGLVLRALANRGYDCRWDIIPAYDDRNFFKGERFFLLAKAHGFGCETSGPQSGNEARISKHGDSLQAPVWNPSKDPMAGTFDGLSPWSHRVRALGNSVVPLQAKTAFKRLMGVL